VKQSVDLDKSRLDGALRPDWSIGYAGRSRFVAARGDDYYSVFIYLFKVGGLVLEVGELGTLRREELGAGGCMACLVGRWSAIGRVGVGRERGSVRRANHRCAGRMGSEWIARD
jgi:hypothetical protein